jgi:hypothetical protein
VSAADRVRRAREQEAELDRKLEAEAVDPYEEKPLSGAEFTRRYGSTHECPGCGEIIPTSSRFCRRCVTRKPWVEQAKARWEELTGTTNGDETTRRYGSDHWYRDESFPCGCAWNEGRYVMLNPRVAMGPTVVARPPNPDCVACGGRIDAKGNHYATGKIRDRHNFMRGKGAGPDSDSTPDAVELAGEFGISEVEAGAFRDRETGQVPELSSGGWHIGTAAPEVPYRPGDAALIGRRREIVPPKRVAEVMSEALWDDNAFDAYLDASGEVYKREELLRRRQEGLRGARLDGLRGARTKRAASHFRDVWTTKITERVSENVLSRVTGVDRRRINERALRGQRIGQNTTKDEGENNDMTTAEMAEDIRQIRNDVRAIRSLTEHEAAMMPLRFQQLDPAFSTDLTISELPDEELDRFADPPKEDKT